MPNATGNKHCSEILLGQFGILVRQIYRLSLPTVNVSFGIELFLKGPLIYLLPINIMVLPNFQELKCMSVHVRNAMGR